MNWAYLGWGFIGFSALTLIVLTLLFKLKPIYPIRRMMAVEAWQDAARAAIEQGQDRQIVLGHDLWSQATPGVGLLSLASLSASITPENVLDDRLTVSAGEGSLLVFARQIIQGRYQDGFSTALQGAVPQVHLALPGPTPLSFSAGFLAGLTHSPRPSAALFGNYGPEALLWAESTADKGGHVFATAGSLASQAVLYLTVRDLLIGEEIFLTPGLIETTTESQTSWAAEDLLRLALILLLVVGALLQMIGVL